MLAQARDLFDARDLLWAWTGRTIRARYQQSALGWLWALIQPAATVAIFSFIFTKFVPVDTGEIPYVVFSYVAVVPWTFLSGALTGMSSSLVHNMDLVIKIYFPREALPIAAMLARCLDFGIAFVLLLVLIIVYQMPVSIVGWLFLPIIFAIQILLMLGLGLACAALNVFYRDVQVLLALGLQIWFYASPIIYPVAMVPERYQRLYYFNPMAGILQGYRDVLLSAQFPGTYLTQSALVSMVIFILGYWFFKRVEFLFADIV